MDPFCVNLDPTRDSAFPTAGTWPVVLCAVSERISTHATLPSLERSSPRDRRRRARAHRRGHHVRETPRWRQPRAAGHGLVCVRHFVPPETPGLTYVNPVFGERVRRLTTDHVHDDIYARNMWWNADGYGANGIA